MPGTCAAEGGEVPGAKTEPCGGGGNEMGQRRRAGCGPEAGERPGERHGDAGAKAERLEERGADAQGTWWRMWWGKGGRAERRKGGRKGAPGRKSPCARLFHGGSRMPGPGLRERECRKSGGPGAGPEGGERKVRRGKREEHKGKRGWRATAQGGSGTRERVRGKGRRCAGPDAGPVFGEKGKIRSKISSWRATATAKGRERMGAGQKKAPAHGFFTGEAARRGRGFGRGAPGRRFCRSTVPGFARNQSFRPNMVLHRALPPGVENTRSRAARTAAGLSPSSCRFTRKSASTRMR